MPSSSQRRLRRGGIIALLVAAVIVAGALASHYLHLSSARADPAHRDASPSVIHFVRDKSIKALANHWLGMSVC